MPVRTIAPNEHGRETIESDRGERVTVEISKQDVEWAHAQGLISAAQVEPLWAALEGRARGRARFDFPHLLLRRTRRHVGDGLVRQPRLGALRRGRTPPDRGRLCSLLQSCGALPLGAPGAQGPGRPPLHPGGLDDAAGNLRFRADDGDVAATRSWRLPELLRVGEERMVLYGGWDD